MEIKASFFAISLILQFYHGFGFTCTQEGVFPSLNDCNSYVTCIRSSEGAFTSQLGSCGIMEFDPLSGECVNEGTTCRRRRQSKSFSSSPDHNSVCSNDTSFACADCRTLLTCINGFAYIESCAAGDTCVNDQNLGGGVCSSTSNEACQCEAPNSFRSDAFDQSKFVYCEGTGQDPLVYQCPPGTVFNLTSSTCDRPDNRALCSAIGFFADAPSCSTYHSCLLTRQGWLQTGYECETGQLYNEDSGKCENPCEWPKQEFECKVHGRFPKISDCRTFHECVPLKDGSLRLTERKCPEGFNWLQQGDEQGRCTTHEKSNCNPVRPNKCKVDFANCPNEI